MGERTQPIPFLDEIEDDGPPRPRSGASGRFFLILLAVLITFALLAVLGLAWVRETDRRKDAESSIAAARSEASSLEAQTRELQGELDALERRLATVRKNLGNARTDAGKRRVALRHAKHVLAPVAPLSKAYEESEAAFSDATDERKAVSEIATAVSRDLVQFSDYLADTDRDSVSLRYLRAQAAWLSGRIAALRRANASAAAALEEHADGQEQVDAGFEALEKAIARLRKEITRALRR